MDTSPSEMIDIDIFAFFSSGLFLKERICQREQILSFMSIPSFDRFKIPERQLLVCKICLPLQNGGKMFPVTIKYFLLIFLYQHSFTFQKVHLHYGMTESDMIFLRFQVTETLYTDQIDVSSLPFDKNISKSMITVETGINPCPAE